MFTMRWLGMEGKNSYHRQRGAALLVGVTLIVFGCDGRVLDDLSSDPKYTSLIGARYRIAEGVRAYGIQDYERREKGVLYVTLIPGVGIGGPEVVFNKPVESGSIFTVQRVLKHSGLLDSIHDSIFGLSGLVYIGKVQGSELPQDKEVRLNMSRGNEGIGLEPNEQIYQRIR